MNKKMLQAGYVVEIRNKKRYLIIVVNNKLYLSNNESYFFSPLKYSFNDDLTHAHCRENDIMKIYNFDFAVNLSNMLAVDDKSLIWERKEKIYKIVYINNNKEILKTDNVHNAYQQAKAEEKEYNTKCEYIMQVGEKGEFIKMVYDLIKDKEL